MYNKKTYRTKKLLHAHSFMSHIQHPTCFEWCNASQINLILVVMPYLISFTN